MSKWGVLEDAKLEAEEILKIDPRFTSKGFEKIIPFKMLNWQEDI